MAPSRKGLRIAVQYLEAELPKFWREYQELAESGVNDEEADQIAAAQANGGQE